MTIENSKSNAKNKKEYCNSTIQFSLTLIPRNVSSQIFRQCHTFIVKRIPLSTLESIYISPTQQVTLYSLLKAWHCAKVCPLLCGHSLLFAFLTPSDTLINLVGRDPPTFDLFFSLFLPLPRFSPRIKHHGTVRETNRLRCSVPRSLDRD